MKKPRKTQNGTDTTFANILARVREAMGMDFSNYKRPTIERRIERRMAMKSIKSDAEYMRFIMKNKDEAAALGEDILIHVTEFFRDEYIYSALRAKVFPRLMYKRAPEKAIRVWVAGCSSGEEVYSIAITLLEYMHAKKTSYPIQIFGTDISDLALHRARHGIYDARVASQMPPDLLKRYFLKAPDDMYQISKGVRDMCIFAKHNMVADTPFSNLDIVSCRNVLIYLDAPLQKRAIPIFHYALRPEGFLVLGTSETTGAYSDLFVETDKKSRIYERRSTVKSSMHFSPVGPAERFKVHPVTEPLPDFDVEREAHKILLGTYTPSWVIVNDDFTIRQFRGETHPYLMTAPGKASFNILKMARKELISALSKALSAARKTNSPSHARVRMNIKGSFTDVKVEVVPMGVRTNNRHFLVIFRDEASGKVAKGSISENTLERDDEQIEQMQKELIETTEHMQMLIERQEASNEELRSANEEIMSSNEELQSVNEELETAQEEVRSANEELLTVNAELKLINEELRSSKEMLERRAKERTHILDSIRDHAVIFLDAEGKITSWNPTAQKLKGYTSEEIVGKSISAFYTDEDKKAGKPEKLLRIAAQEGQVEDISWRKRKDGTIFWADVIISAVNGDDGKLLGFVKVTRDLTEQKKLVDQKEEFLHVLETTVDERTKQLREETEKLKESEERFSKAFMDCPVAVAISDEATNVIFDANAAFAKLIGLDDRTQVIGRTSAELGISPTSTVSEDIVRQFKEHGTVAEVEMSLKRADGTNVEILLSVRRIQIGSKPSILGILVDLTDRKRMIEELREADKKKNEFISILSHELRNPLAPILTHAEFLQEILKGEDVDRKAVGENADIIVRQVRNMARLLDDLLDVSRILRNRVELKKEDIDLRKVVSNAIETTHPFFEQRGIKIAIETSRDPIVVHVDPMRIEQIIVNILNNAAKYSESRTNVYVRCGREGNIALIRIRDEGRGISQELLPKIFDLFVRASTGQPQEGLGIGLALARNLAQLHGGDISVKSEGQGKGSEFVVRIPLHN